MTSGRHFKKKVEAGLGAESVDCGYVSVTDNYFYSQDIFVRFHILLNICILTTFPYI